MSLRTEQGYNFTVKNGNLMQSSKGTHGFQILLENSEGDTEFTIWLTDANRQGAYESFKALGISAEDLASRSFIEHQLCNVVVGREVYGWMREEEYRGKTSLKVAWIGKKREETPGDLAAAVAGFFVASLPDDSAPF